MYISLRYFCSVRRLKVTRRQNYFS